jgi:hypothetical protein
MDERIPDEIGRVIQFALVRVERLGLAAAAR